ncbi:MAG: hypothetical protein CSA42_02855 [Gammaproteobacteria bacterium]|nr:MAG: hypothetical protein CSA42_02855 [Gammaproteobacteria bacterium]
MRFTNTHQKVSTSTLLMVFGISIILMFIMNGTAQAKEYRMSTAIGNTANNSFIKPVDLSGISTTTHELALMQVLAEVCPGLISTNLRPKFAHAYRTKLHQLMPTVANPDNAMRYLSTQTEYRRVHANIKNWTLSYSRAENKAMCEELATTQF